MTEKRYTDEFVTELRTRYTEAEGYEAEQAVIKEIANETDFTVPQLRAKLVAEKVYNAKPTVPAGKRRVRKAELVTQLATLVGEPEETVETFEKANAKALEIVVGRLRAWKARAEAAEAVEAVEAQ